MRNPDLGLTEAQTRHLLRDQKHSSPLRVLQWFSIHGPATAYECENALEHMPVSPYIKRLVEANCLYTTGERRPTRGKSTAAVYTYVEGSKFVAYLGLPPKGKRTPISTTPLTRHERILLDSALTYWDGVKKDPSKKNTWRLARFLLKKLNPHKKKKEKTDNENQGNTQLNREEGGPDKNAPSTSEKSGNHQKDKPNKRNHPSLQEVARR